MNSLLCDRNIGMEMTLDRATVLTRLLVFLVLTLLAGPANSLQIGNPGRIGSTTGFEPAIGSLQSAKSRPASMLLTCSSTGTVKDARCYPGADVSVMVNNCVADAITSGGICDARGLDA